MLGQLGRGTPRVCKGSPGSPALPRRMNTVPQRLPAPALATSRRPGKDALSAYTDPGRWRGDAPPAPPFPLHTLPLQVEHPHPPGRGSTLASPALPPPTLAACTGRGGAGEGGDTIAAGTPPQPAPPPPALPPPLHANDAAQRVRREGGRREGGREGRRREEGGRGPPYLALSPPLPLTCSGRAMRLPASR